MKYILAIILFVSSSLALAETYVIETEHYRTFFDQRDRRF